MYDYKPNWTGIRAMMTTDARLKVAVERGAYRVLALASSLAPVDTAELRDSGRIEDRGIKRVRKGEPRMTIAVVFDAPHAAAVEGRTGFLSGAAGRRRNVT